MPRRVFFSFSYQEDFWRTQQVRNIGAIAGNYPCTGNKWETLKRQGSSAISRWIRNEMKGKSTLVVLVGEDTATRPWVNYEIQEAWNSGMAVLGVRIHKLKNQFGQSGETGDNPFANFMIEDFDFDEVVECHEPILTWFMDSKEIYQYISDHLPSWIEDAIEIRESWGCTPVEWVGRKSHLAKVA